MTKSDFLDILRERIAGLPDWEAAKTVVFYSEMIDDRVEDGMDEEEAVAALGSIDDIVKEVCAGIGAESETKEKSKEKRPRKINSAWMIALIVLSSPLWIMLIAAAVMIVLSAYITVLSVLWSIVVSLFAVTVFLLVCGPAAAVVSVVHFFGGRHGAGLFYAGAGLVLFGLGLFLIRPAVWFARLSARITKWIFVAPVKLIRRKKNEA